jgi:putative copper resistance protein D
VILAHIGVTSGPILLAWTLDPPLLVALGLAAAAWLMVVRRVNAAHSQTPMPAWRSWAFVGGLLVLFVALQSPIDTFADDLFSVHMVQHILLGFVVAPLLVLAAPMTLLLRWARPGPRRRLLLPVLHSRALRVLLAPPLTWLLFAAVMWAVHFTTLFEAALESEPIHQLEHVLLLGSGILFWLPVIGNEPMPWRMSWSWRLLYLFLAMPLTSLLGLVLYAQAFVLYPHYLLRLGPAALDDQRAAATIMWIGSDLLFMGAIGLLVWAWSRALRLPPRALASGTPGNLPDA